MCVCPCVHPSHFEHLFLSNRWVDFHQTWRIAGYTMRKCESYNSGGFVLVLVVVRCYIQLSGVVAGLIESGGGAEEPASL